MTKARSVACLLCVVFLPHCAASHAQQPEAAGRLRRVRDPVEIYFAPQLTPEDEQALTQLFVRVDSDDFDERQRAQNAIVAYGPRAAASAKLHEASPALEVREFARRFRGEMLLHYRGYLPVDPGLRAKLLVPRRIFIGKGESLRDALTRLLRDAELFAAFSWKSFPERVVGGAETVELTLPSGEALNHLLAMIQCVALPRGDGVVVVPRDDAVRFDTQEHIFPMPGPRAEALAAVLKPWLPENSKVAAADKGLRVEGTETVLRIAARAIFAAESLGAEEQFPIPEDPRGMNALLEILAQPVRELSCGGVSARTAAGRLAAQGHPVLYEDRCTGKGDEPAVSLKLAELPLGVVLHWITTRANRGHSPENISLLRVDWNAASETNGERSVKPSIRVLRVCDPAVVLSETVGAADIGGLLPAGPLQGHLTAAAFAHAVQRLLAEHLENIPHEPADFAIAVSGKRILIRGPPPLVSHALALLSQWRKTEAQRPPWNERIDAALEKKVSWDGRSLAPSALLPILREQSGLNILLENADPAAKPIEIPIKDAALLPPGEHSIRELFDRLSVVAKAPWKAEAGVIVFTRPSE